MKVLKYKKKIKILSIENFFEQKLDNKNINLINIEYKLLKHLKKAQKNITHTSKNVSKYLLN